MNNATNTIAARLHGAPATGTNDAEHAAALRFNPGRRNRQKQQQL